MATVGFKGLTFVYNKLFTATIVSSPSASCVTVSRSRTWNQCPGFSPSDLHSCLRHRHSSN